MWRAAPAKVANISRGELSQYRSRSAVNGGRRPFAIARAIRLAYSSVGEDFGWARLIGLPSCESRNGSWESHLGLVKVREIHCTKTTANLRLVKPQKLLSFGLSEDNLRFLT
jgi:hypothetical protein